MRIRSSRAGKSNRRSMSRHRADATLKSSANDVARRHRHNNVLVIDIGGSSVKILATGQSKSRSFRSGPKLSPKRMVSEVRRLAADWDYDAVAIGYPGQVSGGRPSAEPFNLGGGWIGFDFAQALGLPVKVINDAAMQALGSYRGGRMLFLGLGTGLGSAMVLDGVVAPMELGHLPYKKGTYEDYVGRAGLEHAGKKKWRRRVADVVERLMDALLPDETVIGGGNVKKLDVLPARCRAGKNANAFVGGFRLWAGTKVRQSPATRATASNQKGKD
jgi:polyphosphate glucokinase